MTSITEEKSGQSPEVAQPKSIADALEYSRAFEQVASFLAANPDLARCADVHLAPYTNIYVSPAVDAVAFILDAARKAREFGAQVEEWVDGRLGGVKIFFGPVYIKVYAEADRVVRRVVVGMVEDVKYALTFDLDGNPRSEVPA